MDTFLDHCLQIAVFLTKSYTECGCTPVDNRASAPRIAARMPGLQLHANPHLVEAEIETFLDNFKYVSSNIHMMDVGSFDQGFDLRRRSLLRPISRMDSSFSSAFSNGTMTSYETNSPSSIYSTFGIGVATPSSIASLELDNQLKLVATPTSCVSRMSITSESLFYTSVFVLQHWLFDVHVLLFRSVINYGYCSIMYICILHVIQGGRQSSTLEPFGLML